MAVPSDLTATTIVTEAYNRAGIDSPTTAQITRGEGQFLREILGDIQADPTGSYNRRLKSLQTSQVQIGTINQSKYTFATDFDEEITISILDGEHSGTAQAGAATTITLESGEDAGESEVEGKYILTTGGTGSAQVRQCIDYNTSTLVATVDSAWTTNPDATSTYTIINQTTELEEDNALELAGIGHTFEKGKPDTFTKVYEAENIRFIFDRPLDDTYGIFERYYVDVNKLDLTGNHIQRIYNKWHHVLVSGVAMKVAEDQDDNKYVIFEKQYEDRKTRLIADEIVYGGEFTQFTL